MASADEPATDVVTLELASRNHTAVAVSAILNTSHWPACNPLIQLTGGDLAAAVGSARPGADLAGFWRIHAPQPDPLVLDFQSVAVDHRGSTHNGRRWICARDKGDQGKG